MDATMICRESTEKMREVLSGVNLSFGDVSLIMSEVRKLIDENEVWRKKLRLLHFYCDWCQHDKIDRNPESVQIIADLNRCL